MSEAKIQTTDFDPHKLRADFPILSRQVHGKPLVYLDNAASAQKPVHVTGRMQRVFDEQYSNVHRGLHYLSNASTEAFEAARRTVQSFLNAASDKEIIFTGGATDAINLVAHSYLAPRITPGDEIILSEMEHHSNIVPWHFLREQCGAVLKWVPVSDDGALDMEAYAELLGPRTKFVSLTQMSNALGTVTDAKRIIELAHAANVPVLLDGCQGAVHMATDVQNLDVDFYVFSGHKVYGPGGIGVMYAKAQLLETMRPYRGGGEMIRDVTLDDVTYADPPHRFEAGTPPIVEAIGLGAALDYMTAIGWDNITAHERALADHAMDVVGGINRVQIFGTTPDKGAIVSFIVDGIHPHDLAMVMDRAGVAVRAGHHCAQPLMKRFDVPATARASFAIYNTHEEVEALGAALNNAIAFFG
ncbi:MAG: cysteine desulfurase [PS1 clade bacterium]|nr:cysteine desulfurase [PS1 clade bacterium]CAI8359196.1 MAG: Cysteine desulfurase [Rhodobiaceae bacterium UBA7378]HCQ81890.1 cysteine desulfurase [Rhodobiaceae bacterium]|tara:strand:- start:127 stop:1371 length:1245 start_codon:yes stop_codon:yes gene_type:complete